MAANPQRRAVLQLYRRAFSLVGPYVDSPGVQEFMKREMVRELSAQGMTKEKILELEQVVGKKENLLEACKENVRSLFRDKMNEDRPAEIEYLVRQGQVELDAVEEKIIKEKRRFGMVKEGGDLKYVVTPREQEIK